MRTTTIASCALPALLLGIVFAANAAQRPTGHAGLVDARTGKLLRKPTAEERQSLAEAVAVRQRTVKRPRTEAEARSTLVRKPNGALSSQVPTSLWSTMAAETDAQGRIRIREYDGDQAPTTAYDGGLEK